MDQLTQEFDVQVRWWPFELHPETPREGRDVDELLGRSGRGRAYKDHLKAYAAEAGITLASNRKLSNSHRALELAEFARDHGCFDAVHHALFRAYFEEAKDIGDEAELESIAGEAGLDIDEWRAASKLGRYARLVDEATAVAHRAGYSSTPTMIVDNRMVIPGAQEYLVYQDVLKRMEAPRREP